MPKFATIQPTLTSNSALRELPLPFDDHRQTKDDLPSAVLQLGELKTTATRDMAVPFYNRSSMNNPKTDNNQQRFSDNTRPMNRTAIEDRPHPSSDRQEADKNTSRFGKSTATQQTNETSMEDQTVPVVGRFPTTPQTDREPVVQDLMSGGNGRFVALITESHNNFDDGIDKVADAVIIKAHPIAEPASGSSDLSSSSTNSAPVLEFAPVTVTNPSSDESVGPRHPHIFRAALLLYSCVMSEQRASQKAWHVAN